MSDIVAVVLVIVVVVVVVTLGKEGSVQGRAERTTGGDL